LRYADACRESGEDVVVLDESVSTLRGGVPLAERVALEDGELSFRSVDEPSGLRRLRVWWELMSAMVAGLLMLAIAVLAAGILLLGFGLLRAPFVGVLLLVELAVCGAMLAAAGWFGWWLGRGGAGLAVGVFVTLCMALPVVAVAGPYVQHEERTYAVLRIA